MQPYMGLGNSLQTAQGGSAAGVGGWVELARTTLGSAGDTIDVTSLSDKRYYMVLGDIDPSGTVNNVGRFNSDSGTNYSQRGSVNGGADGASTSLTQMSLNGAADGVPKFYVQYIANLAAKEKLSITHLNSQNTAGAGTAPLRLEEVHKWANTANSISSIQNNNVGGGNYATGSEVVVLGWDPADTHTTNFWEELASVTATGGETSLDSGTITAKKYLWVQSFMKAQTSSMGIGGNFNSDVGTNYSNRWSDNGASDGTNITNSNMTWIHGGTLASGEVGFNNIFIINNSANEKLVIGHNTLNNTAGAGTAGDRREFTNKWANTVSQITQVELERVSGTGTFAAGSIIKVYGSD